MFGFLSRALVLCWLTLMGFGATALHAQRTTEDIAAQIDSVFAAPVRAGKFSGNVLVAMNDQVICRRSYGIADRLTGRLLDSSSVFELASLSKQFTAMGILLLGDEGKLSLDDSLRKFFPELPYPGVTLKQMLHHTSGLPDYMHLFAAHWDSSKIAGNTDMIAMLARWKPPLLFRPGSAYAYSNTGYALLASVISKVSHKSYGEYLAARIFRPLRMSSTLVFRRRYEGGSIANFAYGYVKDKNGHLVLPDSLYEYAAMVRCLDGMEGDGAVNSGTGDLFRWSRALRKDPLFARLAADGMFRMDTLANGELNRYGYGWAIDSIQGAGRVVNHSGGWPGYVTFIERQFPDGYTIIILQNLSGPMPGVQRIREILKFSSEPFGR